MNFSVASNNTQHNMAYSWEEISNRKLPKFRNLTFRNGMSELSNVSCLRYCCMTQFINTAESALGNIMERTLLLHCNIVDCENLSCMAFSTCNFNECIIKGIKNESGYVSRACNYFKSVIENCTCYQGFGLNLDRCIVKNNVGSQAIFYRANLTNNLIIDNKGNSIWMGNGSNAGCINNNIFLNNEVNPTRPQRLIYNHYNSKHTYINNNVVDRVDQTKLFATQPNANTLSSFHVSGNVYNATLDKLHFKNAENDDYHLLNGSIAINAGAVEYLSSNVDIEGKKWNDPPAAGPYEYQNEFAFVIPNKVVPI